MFAPYPVWVRDGRGVYLTDVDGNDYFDPGLLEEDAFGAQRGSCASFDPMAGADVDAIASGFGRALEQLDAEPGRA